MNNQHNSISYKIFGEGQSIFFIHGIGSRKHSWNNIIRKLEDKYKCITYDLRGHGDSQTKNYNFTLDDLLEDLEILRKKLNINKFHIVGHSLGGMIGPSYARKYKNVISLSILSTAAFRTINEREKILNIIKKIEKDGLDLILPNLINRWFTEKFIKNNKDLINKRIDQVKQTQLEIFLNVFRIYALTEMGPWLNEIKIPCLVVTGENDLGCNPIINKKIAASIPNATLNILKDLKHSITLESPNVVGAVIRNFLDNL